MDPTESFTPASAVSASPAPLERWPWNRTLPRAVVEAVMGVLVLRLLVLLMPFSPLEVPSTAAGWVSVLGPTAIGVAVSIALRWCAPQVATRRLRHWMHSTGEPLFWLAMISPGADADLPSWGGVLLAVVIMSVLAVLVGRCFARFQTDADRARHDARAA